MFHVEHYYSEFERLDHIQRNNHSEKKNVGFHFEHILLVLYPAEMS